MGISPLKRERTKEFTPYVLAVHGQMVPHIFLPSSIFFTGGYAKVPATLSLTHTLHICRVYTLRAHCDSLRQGGRKQSNVRGATYLGK